MNRITIFSIISQTIVDDIRNSDIFMMHITEDKESYARQQRAALLGQMRILFSFATNFQSGTNWTNIVELKVLEDKLVTEYGPDHWASGIVGDFRDSLEKMKKAGDDHIKALAS